MSAPDFKVADPFEQLDSNLREQEQQIFDRLIKEPENEQHHKDYVGFVLKNNLMKVAARRYGPLIDDKEKLSIEARRFARTYQRHLINAMFLIPKTAVKEKKRPELGYLLVFMAMIMVIIGLMASNLHFVSFIGALILFVYFFVKIRQRRGIEETRNEPPQF